MNHAPAWLDPIDSLAFVPAGHEGRCVVHRLAFRALLRKPPAKDDCLAFFMERRGAFEAAAQAKISARSLGPSENFHLSSRDLRAALAAEVVHQPAGGGAHHDPE